MSTPNENGVSNPDTQQQAAAAHQQQTPEQHHRHADDGLRLETPTAARIDSPIPKNKSTSNLLLHSTDHRNMAVDTRRARLSFDAGTLHSTRSPILPEPEHGIGISGLRRIRQKPTNRPGTAATAQTSRHSSLNIAIPSSSSSRHPTANLSASTPLTSGHSSPTHADFGEDLSRFPSESLHSFSFAHQSDEFLHNRQNVLKRSIDFMRDKMGWGATNAGIAAAQAKLSGDLEVQSMVELLTRAHLIGQDASQGHPLGVAGPLTGPADTSGENLFERSLGDLPRTTSPEPVEDAVATSPKSGPPPRVASKGGSPVVQTIPDEEVTFGDRETIESLSKRISNESTSSDATERLASAPTRAKLKRTFTDTAPLQLQSKLHDAMAQPYVVDHQPGAHPVLSPKAAPALPPPLPTITNTHAVGTAPHGHGTRWSPAAQAIFTTEAHAPWTITAANDLACLVFGVTRAEVRRIGIMEVVRPERRKWLAEKLGEPEAAVTPREPAQSQTQSETNSPTHRTSLAVGKGVTAKLLSKPNSRQVAQKRRAQTDDGAGSTYVKKKAVKGGLNHEPNRSRGVLLCGDVVPIQKRNGALGSASLWVKEKRGGLIWVLEEIAEDVVEVSVDEVGCVTRASGAIEAVFGIDRLRRGMDIKRLIPDIPRVPGTNTGALDYEEIARLRSFTARTSNSINIPITVEQLPGQPTFRVSSFPHIAGIIVLSTANLTISGSNTVFSSALFGQPHPNGLHINELIPGFDRILHVMTDEDQIQLVDGIVIPEHSFRRARALLAMREGSGDAAAVFLRPSGLPAKHRDGSEIMVDVQMRVVRSDQSAARSETVIEETESEGEGGEGQGAAAPPVSHLVYALWVTYSRHLHATNHGVGPVTPLVSRPGTPPHQPSPGQTTEPLGSPDEAPENATPTPDGAADENHGPVSLLTQQLRGNMPPIQRAPTTTQQVPTLSRPGPEAERAPSQVSSPTEPPHKKTINDFVVLEDMGQGAYGQVKLCRYKKNSNKKMVIKYVTKRRILVDTWTRDRRLGTVPLEIHVLDYLRRDGLRHPNIVEMADFFEDDVNYYIEMVPHGLPGMDLFDYIELRVNMDEAECRKIFVQVASALHHLHTVAKVVHRDIKDENVVLDGEGRIKLIDFGSAAYIKSGPFDVFVGTIDYAAPEVLAGAQYRGKEQDVWALGILLYTILYKENPFYSIDEIMDHDLRVPYVLSEASIELVRLMLDRDVERRITIGQVLAHRWCRGEGGDAGDAGGAVVGDIG